MGVWTALAEGTRLIPVGDWPEGTEAGTWLVLGVAHGRIPTRWRVLDLDNPARDPNVAAAIDALGRRLVGTLAASGHRSFFFPSRSAIEYGSGAGHLYAWFPELTPEEQEARLLTALSVALGRTPAALSPGERQETGLNPGLHVFFPPREDVGAALSVAPLAAIARFRTLWEVFVGSDKKL
jgi:hypothetical protein